MKLSVTGAGIEDFTAIVDDADFFAKPVAVGDAVPLAWDAEDADRPRPPRFLNVNNNNKQGNRP